MNGCYLAVLSCATHPVKGNCPALVLSQVSQNPDNDGRLFVISYFLSNDMISIFENAIRNSGIISGKFLEKTRVPKPGSTADKPQFYSPADFVIGAIVQSNRVFLSCFIADIHGQSHNLFLCSNQRQKVASISVVLMYHAALSSARLNVICSVSVFSHRFLLVDADLYVLSYLEANADSIPPETLESVRRKLNADGATNQAWAQIGTEDQS